MLEIEKDTINIEDTIMASNQSYLLTVLFQTLPLYLRFLFPYNPS